MHYEAGTHTTIAQKQSVFALTRNSVVRSGVPLVFAFLSIYHEILTSLHIQEWRMLLFLSMLLSQFQKIYTVEVGTFTRQKRRFTQVRPSFTAT